MTAMMTEAAAVARHLGVAAEPDIPTWIRNFAAIGPFQTSMLQDFRAGKPIELDPILGAVIELARMVGIRSDERRVGQECVSTGRSRWWAYPYKTKKNKRLEQ